MSTPKEERLNIQEIIDEANQYKPLCEINVRIASAQGEHGILSAYPSSDGTYLWIDIEERPRQ